jgi:hypothetical protein
MALVPHKITALAESDAEGTDGKNIVAGAVVSLYDTDGSAVTLFDNESGANGSTAKQTDSTGQVVVWVTAGEYDEEVNGSIKRRVNVGGNSVISYETTESLGLSRPNKAGQRAENRERANAQYVLSASGYTALPGDIVAANGRVWVLQSVNGDWDVLHFGATRYETGTPTIDSKEAFDNAILRAESEIILPQGCPNVIIPSGKYRIGSEGDAYGITLLQCSLRGSGSFGCSLVWGGDADGVMIRYKPRRHKKVTGFRCDALNEGSNNPSIWLDCTYDWDNTGGTGSPLYGVMDWGDTFNDLFFTNTSATAGSCHMNFATITNLYMRDMRFQAAPHLIKFNQGAGSTANRVFSLEDWTTDFGGLGSGVVESLFKVQMSGDAQMTINLKNQRIESSSIEMSGNKAIVELVDDLGPNDLRSDALAFTMENCSLQISGTGNSLVYQDTTQTTVTTDISLKNCRLAGIDTIHGGTWNAFFATPEPESFNNKFLFWSTGRVNSEGQIQIGTFTTEANALINTEIGNGVISGTGNPEGNVTAEKGTLFLRQDGGAGFTIYAKTTSGGDTGWFTMTTA